MSQDGKNLLRIEIERRLISPAQAAKELGVNKSTISVWLHGIYLPTATKRDLIDAWSAGRVPASAWRSAEDKKAIAKARRTAGAP